MTRSEEGKTKLERKGLARAQEKKSQTIGIQSEWSEWASIEGIQRKITGGTYGKEQTIKDFEKQTKEFD